MTIIMCKISMMHSPTHKEGNVAPVGLTRRARNALVVAIALTRRVGLTSPIGLTSRH